ncbi:MULTISPECIES: hydroxyphenylacetyl-CoA thioesterase PaaI [unclassified Sinorhizobium]|uniref:hydroxyphenylacetyl-CoA thioesterase PaaI n=1 Tax=unclassified Sinorhizobium TaxID=2613772 RepID=UPI003524E04E
MSVAKQLSPQGLAEACANAMWANDHASQFLNMKLIEVAPGKASIQMTVTRCMLNGHQSCHGGYIFTVADSALAFACNGYNQWTVAQHCSVTFIAPAFEGDVLTARAKEVFRRGRGGIYDVTVVNQQGEQIAEFRGHSRTVKGTHLPEDR